MQGGLDQRDKAIGEAYAAKGFRKAKWPKKKRGVHLVTKTACTIG